MCSQEIRHCCLSVAENGWCNIFPLSSECYWDKTALDHDFMPSYCFLIITTVTPRLLIVCILVRKMFWLYGYMLALLVVVWVRVVVEVDLLLRISFTVGKVEIVTLELFLLERNLSQCHRYLWWSLSRAAVGFDQMSTSDKTKIILEQTLAKFVLIHLTLVVPFSVCRSCVQHYFLPPLPLIWLLFTWNTFTVIYQC